MGQSLVLAKTYGMPSKIDFLIGHCHHQGRDFIRSVLQKLCLNENLSTSFEF